MKEYFLDTYNEITHTTIATVLAEEDYLTETNMIQISFCHRSASMSFREQNTLDKLCEPEHLLPPNTCVKFEPDYHTRIRISIENIPVTP